VTPIRDFVTLLSLTREKHIVHASRSLPLLLLLLVFSSLWLQHHLLPLLLSNPMPVLLRLALPVSVAAVNATFEYCAKMSTQLGLLLLVLVVPVSVAAYAVDFRAYCICRWRYCCL
jgi:hypothetical protein